MNSRYYDPCKLLTFGLTNSKCSVLANGYDVSSSFRIQIWSVSLRTWFCTGSLSAHVPSEADLAQPILGVLSGHSLRIRNVGRPEDGKAGMEGEREIIKSPGVTQVQSKQRSCHRRMRGEIFTQ